MGTKQNYNPIPFSQKSKIHVIIDQSQIDVVKTHRDRLQYIHDNMAKTSTSARGRYFAWIERYDLWLQEFNLKK